MNEAMEKYIDQLLDITDFIHNPYFFSLQESTFDKEDFIETQIQLYIAMQYFPKFLAALIKKLPEYSSELNIIQNFQENYGQNTFLSFLNSLGVSKEEIESRAIWPEVRTFVMALWGTCALDNYLIAVPALGIIEHMFLHVATWTERGVLTNNWLKQDQLGYYITHKKLDKKYAQDFFNLVQNNWNSSSKDKYDIKQGLELGAYNLSQLYRQLYKNRTRRSFKDSY